MFKKKRAARKIGFDDGDDGQEAPPQVQPSSAKLAKAKKAPKAPKRMTLGTEVEDEPEEAVTEDAFAAFERCKTKPMALPLRSPDSPEPAEKVPAPSLYSSEYLASLRSEQQRAPPKPSVQDEIVEDDYLSDAPQPELSSNLEQQAQHTHFLPSFAKDQPSIYVPSHAEIEEKKERRRRLALEEKGDGFIALDDEGNKFGNSSESDDPSSRRQKRSLIIQAEERPDKPSKHGESRLGLTALDDDDLAEGFDSFVDDPGRVALGASGLRAQEAQRRADIAAQIQQGEGEGEGGDAEDAEAALPASERRRLRAHEKTQTKHGTYAQRHTQSDAHRRAHSRSRSRSREARWRRAQNRAFAARPVPVLGDAVAQYRAVRAAQQAERAATVEKIAEIAREREEIRVEEERVQQLVKETGERLEKLMAERAGKEKEDVDAVDAKQDQVETQRNGVDEVANLSHEDVDMDEDDDDEDVDAAPGLDSTSGADPFDRPTSFQGMARIPSPEW